MARRRLPRAVFDFIDGGADDELTMKANRADLDRVLFKPRYLVDVARIDTGCTILGQPQGMPLGMSPTGLATMACPDGELALAREAAASKIPMILSTLSGCTIEDVAATGPGSRWFQLYVFRNRAITESLVARAAKAGYQALVLTVDVPVAGKRRRDVHSGFTIPMAPSAATVLDMACHPRWCFDALRHGLPRMRNLDAFVTNAGAQTHAALIDSQLGPGLDWSVLAWLRSQWPGKLVIKGLLSTEDALRAAEAGVDGIVVSNHGGRQQDAVPSSISMLARIAPLLKGGPELFIDSGIRSGADIVRAIALGARAALIGRATLYGAAAAGQAGIRHCLDLLQSELERTMALLGVTAIDQIGPDCLAALPWPASDAPVPPKLARPS